MCVNVTNIYLSVSEPHNKSDFSLSVSHILIIFKSWCKVDNVDVHVCVFAFVSACVEEISRGKEILEQPSVEVEVLER